MPDFVPVDHDPQFDPQLVPVDHDPVFDSTQQQTPEGYPWYQASPTAPAAANIGPGPGGDGGSGFGNAPGAGGVAQTPAPVTVGGPQRSALDPDLLRRIEQIESGSDPNNRTGSYHGLFQLSWPEFVKYGGRGNIYDPEQNRQAAINKIVDESNRFRSTYGRDPTPTEIYLTHQQGEGGLAQHMANPDAPAWVNMASTAEGRQKGAGWARAAIWGNIPDSAKAQFGSVDNISSRQFMDLWRGRVEGPNAGPGGYDDSAFQAAAYRQRQAVQPTGGRQRGFATMLLENYLPHVLGGMAAVPQQATQAAGEFYRTGEYNPAPVMQAAGMAMTGGMPFAQPGAIGIFGGRLAQTANLEALQRAESMAAAGTPKEAIWNQTGWFQGADGQWRFWIPDIGAKTRIGFGAGPEQPLEHPELMRAYPQLKDYTVSIDKGPEGGLMMRPGNPEQYPPGVSPLPGYIEARGPTEDVRTSAALHELQHGVQNIEGFTPGGSPGQGMSSRTQSNLAKSVAQRLGMDWDKLDPAKQQEIKNYALHEVYRRIAGETEARNVQEWQYYRPGFEGQRPPWTTEDYPRTEQIMPRPSGRGYGPVIQKLVPVEHQPFAFDDHPGIISTRFPTAVKRTEDPVSQHLTIDTDALRKDPDVFKHNVFLVRKYPNMTRKDAGGPVDQVAENFINHVKDNLLWLYDRVPADIRNGSKLWYDGGNAIIKDRAQQYRLPESSVAGVYAALSPQKDWFMNVSAGNRVLDTWANHQNTPFSPEMATKARQIFQKPDLQRLYNSIQGKQLSELTDPAERAIWIRLYDETHYPKSYDVIAPTGHAMGPMLTDKGVPAKMAWGTVDQIANAVQSIEARGDMNLISPLMGERHKVRSFYDNLLHPNAPYGDVTVDTHAVAAGLLRPLSGKSIEVSHSLQTTPTPKPEGFVGARGSSVTGVRGLYPLYADAYRRAAAERGVLPREMQSVTWEAVRGLFPAPWKAQAKNVAVVNKMWQNYRAGKASLDETRQGIHDYAGGIRAPEWYRP